MFWQISCLDRERGGEGRGVQVAVSATIENEDLEYLQQVPKFMEKYRRRRRTRRTRRRNRKNKKE